MKLSSICVQMLASAFIAMVSSCESNTDIIGSSLLEEKSEVVICNDFTAIGHTAVNTEIESRTTVELLGDFQAEGYGRFRSDFVCQFMPAVRMMASTVTPADIDSMKLVLAYPNGAFVGDSIVPMGLEVYRLNKQLPTPIFSTFDPDGYYDAQPIAKKIYVGNAQGQTDSIAALSYREIYVDLPVSLARELYQLYLDNPVAYSLPSEFAKYFPGIYVKTNYGVGRVMQIQRTTMEIYYHTYGVDEEGNQKEIPTFGTYYAVTPEVVSNNIIKFDMSDKLQARIDAGESIVVAPVGRDVVVEFPGKALIDYYKANCGVLSVVNTLSFSIPAVKIANNYGLEPPIALLMVKSSQRDDFFLNNRLTDDKSSFMAFYNPNTACYDFTEMREYFLGLLASYDANGRIKDEDITFTLTPVSVMKDSSSNGYTTTEYVTAITPYIGRPAVVSLDIDNANISLQFTKQVLKGN